MRFVALALAVAPLILNGCSSTVVVARGGSRSAPAPAPAGPVAKLKIPPGHYPPPGQCRVWLPDRPPGRQPPSASCRAARGPIPPGAWVIYRPTKDKKVVEVTAYDEVKPEVVVWVRVYDAKSGAFLRAGRSQ